jgi:STE24 endopeptidase
MPDTDPERRPDPDALLDAARRYARRRYALFAAHLAFGAGFLVLMALRGSDVIARLVRPLPGADLHPVETLWYFALFSLTYLLLQLPLAVYGDYVTEHEFGLSTLTPGRWVVRRAKRWLLSFALAAPLVVAFYALLKALPRDWWLPAGALCLFVSYVLARFAPRILLPFFHKLEPLDDPDLTGRLAALARKAGITLTGACRIDLSRETKKANAMVMGFGSSRRVALGDTMLDRYSHDEIAVVFAHELGHVVGRDLLKGFVLFGLVSFGSLFAASRLLGDAAGELGIEAVHDPRTLPVLIAILAAIQLLVMPLSNSYSRWRERLCDAFALRTTRDREAFISVMTKLARQNLADVRPNAVVEILLFDHPPIGRRIRFAQHFDLETDA